MVDGLGNPVRWRLTGGEVHDSTQAQGLMKGMQAQSVLADKGYDSNDFVSFIREQQMCAVIPPKRNRTEQRAYDKSLYKERNLVESFFSKLKYFRRVFSRFDKSIRNFTAFLSFVGAILWLR